jgi:hypothetical protein
MQPLPIQVPLDVALYFVQQLPPTYQEAILEWLMLAHEQRQNTVIENIQVIDNQEDNLTFEAWNSEFDNQNLAEFLPEYGMTLLEFRKQQFADETGKTTMNEKEFSFFLKNSWKSQLGK